MSLPEEYPAAVTSVSLHEISADDIISLSRATATYGEQVQRELGLPKELVEATTQALLPPLRAGISAKRPSGNMLPSREEARADAIESGVVSADRTVPGTAEQRVMDELVDRAQMPESYNVSQKYLLFAARCALRGAVHAPDSAERKAYLQVIDDLHAHENTRESIDLVEHPIMTQLRKFVMRSMSVM